MFYNLNKNCRLLRKKLNLSVPELATKLNVKTQSLYNMESGTCNCSLEVLDKLHIIFNISLDDLIYKDLSNQE